MTPHNQLSDLDHDGTAYLLARLDVQQGQNLMKYVEYEVLQHGPEWVELRPHAMQVKTGPRNGTIFTKEDLEKTGACSPVWFRWNDVGPIEIRSQ